MHCVIIYGILLMYATVSVSATSYFRGSYIIYTVLAHSKVRLYTAVYALADASLTYIYSGTSIYNGHPELAWEMLLWPL